MPALTIEQLTTSQVEGTGVFDKLMQGVEAHIQQEFGKNRIKGPEYATVYLGALQSTLDQSIRFLAQQDDALLKDKQLLLLDKQIEKATQEVLLVQEQVASEVKKNELNGILDQQKAQLMAQTAQTEQQTANLTAEALNIPKQGLMLDAQTAVQTQQKLNLTAEKLQTESQTSLIDQQTANEITQNTVLLAQECKLSAEFDLIMEQKLKTVAESALLGQKKATETAQTSNTAHIDSVIGKQIEMYKAQRNGYYRDAEQKAAKLLVDTWNVRRTTNESTEHNDTNKLSDVNIGNAISRLLAGVNQTTV